MFSSSKPPNYRLLEGLTPPRRLHLHTGHVRQAICEHDQPSATQSDSSSSNTEGTCKTCTRARLQWRGTVGDLPQLTYTEIALPRGPGSKLQPQARCDHSDPEPRKESNLYQTTIKQPETRRGYPPQSNTSITPCIRAERTFLIHLQHHDQLDSITIASELGSKTQEKGCLYRATRVPQGPRHRHHLKSRCPRGIRLS